MVGFRADAKIKKSRTRIFLYIAIGFAIVFIFGITIHSVRRAADDIALLRNEMEILSRAVAQTAELSADEREAEAILEKLAHILPGVEELLLVSTSLETLALRFNLGFGFQYGEINEGPPRSIFFTMSLNGGFSQITEYVEALYEETVHIISISSLEIGVDDDGAHRAIISGKLFIR